MVFKMNGFSAFTKTDDKKIVQDIEPSIPEQIKDIKKDIETLKKRNKSGDKELIKKLQDQLKRIQSKN